MTSEDQDLRKWAAEAMTARPATYIPPAMDSHLGVNGARRESEGGLSSWMSKSSAPPAGSDAAYDTFSRFYRPHATDLESSPESHRRSSYLYDGLRDRPSSMFASTSSATQAANASSDSISSVAALDAHDDSEQRAVSPTQSSRQRHGSQRSHHNLKSCLKAGSNIDDDSPSTPLASSSTLAMHPSSNAPTLKSVQISDDLPRHKNDVVSSSDGSPISSPMASKLVRRNAAHKHVSSEQRRRASLTNAQAHVRSHSHNSPSLTESTCDSEEDAPAIVTPLDENGPQYSGNTPPMDTLGDAVADRVGISRGMDQVGSEISEPLRLITQLRLPSRRASLAKEEDNPQPGAHTSPLNAHSALETNAAAGVTATADATAPNLSRSTLLDIGYEPGITPPTSRTNQGVQGSNGDVPFSAVATPTSIVSAGVEMGLGVRMASVALSSQLPETSSSGLNNITEPRFARTPANLDLHTITAGLRLTDSQLPLHTDEPRLSQFVHLNKSDRAADEITFAELDRDDAELNRRRTTGGLQARREAHQGPVGKRRVHRTGTQDPHGDANLNTSSSAHSRHTSLSTMVDIDEAQASGSSNPCSTRGSSPFIGPQALPGATSTPVDTPSHGHKVLLSPSLGHQAETGSFHSRSGHGFDDHAGMHDASGFNKANAGKFAQFAAGNNNLAGGLMGIGEVGHFGPGVRAKVAQLIEAFIGTVPVTGEEGETINLIEYGTLNSRSGLLLRPAISALARRAHQEAALSQEERDKQNVKFGYFDGWNVSDPPSASRKANSGPQQQASRVSFCITHEDAPTSDFRPTMQMLESHHESYLDALWQSRHSPCLTNAIFPAYAARPFASRLAPPRTMHLGISLMDLHWTHTPVNSQVSRATTAQAELTAFLNARANEFKKNGLLVLAYIARSEDSPSPAALSSDPMTESEDASISSTSPSEQKERLQNVSDAKPRKDIWTTLSNTLAPCIQRLVSCGMLKSDVARHLLELPMHPRTAKQTRAALKSVEESWKLEWSCGLGYDGPNSPKLGEEGVPSEPLPLRLAHPAWKAYDSGCLSRNPFTEHMIQLFKNLYESHFRSVLREKGKLSKGAVEFVLDSLWDALFSRIVDQYPSSIKDVEIEVCIYALRRC